MESPNGLYWYATGRGLKELVETGTGILGAVPTYTLNDGAELPVKVQENLMKGYQYVSTPFIRMSAASLAQVTGNPLPVPATAKVVSSLIPVRRVVPPTSSVSNPAPITTPAQLALGTPLNLIRSLRMIHQGGVLTGFSALDEKGKELQVLQPGEARDFACKYAIDVLFL